MVSSSIRFMRVVIVVQWNVFNSYSRLMQRLIGKLIKVIGLGSIVSILSVYLLPLGTNALHAACYSDKCSTKLVELLCQYGRFDLNEANNSGETPLLMAIERNDYELVDYLLRQGALSDQANHDECYPIHLACFNGQANILYLLLAFNATIEQSNENYPHPLVISSYKRDLICSKILIESSKCSDRIVREILIDSIESGFDDLIREILHLRPHLIPDELKDKMTDTLRALEQLNIN